MVMNDGWAPAGQRHEYEGLPKQVKYMPEGETWAASIPVYGDGVEELERTTPGPRWREAPEHAWRSGDAQPGREGYLPRGLRIRLYRDVVALRRGGLTYD
jgi:hypothetical protein